MYTNSALAFFSSFIGVLYLFFLYMLSFGKFEVDDNKTQAVQNDAFVELAEKVTTSYLEEDDEG